MRVPHQLHTNLLSLLACAVWGGMLSSCVIYTHRDRVVRVSHRDTGEPVSDARFQFTHAVPAVHLPEAPERIDVPLGSNGEARVRFPVVMGWARVNGSSVLLHPENVRDGGTFELAPRSASDSGRSAPKTLLRIEKIRDP
jgi:hypothetical protein